MVHRIETEAAPNRFIAELVGADLAAALNEKPRQ
jgi:hypothetical protein